MKEQAFYLSSSQYLIIDNLCAVWLYSIHIFFVSSASPVYSRVSSPGSPMLSPVYDRVAGPEIVVGDFVAHVWAGDGQQYYGEVCVYQYSYRI